MKDLIHKPEKVILNCDEFYIDRFNDRFPERGTMEFKKGDPVIFLNVGRDSIYVLNVEEEYLFSLNSLFFEEKVMAGKRIKLTDEEVAVFLKARSKVFDTQEVFEA